MSNIVIILIVIATVKFFLFGGILWAVFRDDIRRWWKKPDPVVQQPACMYCGSLYTRRADDGQMRWEDNQLVLVTMYECEHCDLPFWNVERVPVAGSTTSPHQHDRI